MSGDRSRGSVLSGEADRGNFDPCDSKINFAVPKCPVNVVYNPRQN